MEKITRRGFVGMAGALGAAAVATATGTLAFGQEASATDTAATDAAATAAADASAAEGGTNATVAELLAEYGAKSWTPRDPYPGETDKNTAVIPFVAEPAPDVLTPEQVDDLINNEITVTEDYVKADGTVVPAAYINLRNKINRNGIGIGSMIATDDQFDVWMGVCTEEQAARYSEMPQYVDFTATDYALKTGRSVEEATEICEDLAQTALLHRVVREGVPFYHTQSQEYGFYEAHINQFTKEYVDQKDAGFGLDIAAAFADSGTCMYRTYPVDLSVVKGEYTPLDDWHAILERNDTFSVSPCMCRTKVALQAGLEPGTLPCADSHPLETCLCTGEHARFIIEVGAGREISRDEAEAVLQNAVDNGMIIESVSTRDAENICCCHSDCCQNVGTIRALNGGPAMEGYSNFYLAHDKDACIQCGACAQRCPMVSIVMDEETGYPIVDDACVRCGQCATVCPVGARWLVLKPEEDRPYIPRNMVEDYQIKARNRAAKGYLYDYPGQTAAAEQAAAASATAE